MNIIEEGTTFGFNSEYWTNDMLLNEHTSPDEMKDAKYQAFLNTPFQSIRMCVDSPDSNCISHNFDNVWTSARDLFSAGYEPQPTLDQNRILEVYGPVEGSYAVSYTHYIT